MSLRVPIVGFPGYEIGSNGIVWTEWKRCGLGCGGVFYEQSGEWRKLKPQPTTQGRLYVRLRQSEGKFVNRFIHLLVLEHFKGPRPLPEMDGCHEDGDHTHNDISNLRWGSKSSNSQDRRKHGTWIEGSESKLAILHEKDVVEILQRHKGGESQSSLARSKNVTVSTVHLIIKNKTWKHIPRTP